MATKYLEPLYGNQDKAVESWMNGKRIVYISSDENNDVKGLVALLDNLDKDYITMSTLLIDKNFRNNGAGKGLLEKAIEYSSGTQNDYLIVTVNENINSTFNLLKKYGFEVIDKLKNKHIIGQTEFVLRRDL